MILSFQRFRFPASPLLPPSRPHITPFPLFLPHLDAAGEVADLVGAARGDKHRLVLKLLEVPPGNLERG